MDLKKAKQIVSDWGGFIEWLYPRLRSIFENIIPESLLPHPIGQIREALNILEKECINKKDQKIIEAIKETRPALGVFWKDEKAILYFAHFLEDKEILDEKIKKIKNFRQLKDEINHISDFFGGISIEKIDFENLDLSTAFKILNIYTQFIKYSSMCLGLIFNRKVPESLLPFPKEYIIKASYTYFIKYKKETKEKADTNIKELLEDGYASDEIAINELIENFSDKEFIDYIIFHIKDFQIKSLYISKTP